MSKIFHKECYVQDLGRIYYNDDSPFHEAVEAVMSRADSLITLKELAYARIQEGRDSSLSKNSSYVKEGSLFVPKATNNRIWLRESLVLQNPSEAVVSHKINVEYLLPENFNADEHLEKIGKENYLVLRNITPIPTNRFDEDERTKWAFGDIAKDYGQVLIDNGIELLNIYMNRESTYIDNRARPFANQLWMNSLERSAIIYGSVTGLYLNNRVRGVLYDNKILSDLKGE